MVDSRHQNGERYDWNVFIADNSIRSEPQVSSGLRPSNDDNGLINAEKVRWITDMEKGIQMDLFRMQWQLHEREVAFEERSPGRNLE